MMSDSSMERSLDAYIRRRIREVPGDAVTMFPGAGARGEGGLDFVYWYYVGRIEEGALRYMLKATRSSAGALADPLEIHARVLAYKREMRGAVGRAFGEQAAEGRS